MKQTIVIILLFSALISSAQMKKTVEFTDVKGVILFKYLPDIKYRGFYCPLKAKIILETGEYDFVPSNGINYSIINENKEFKKQLGEPEKYLTGDILTQLCVFEPSDKRVRKINCDSIIDIYKENNIFDYTLYKPERKEQMTLTIMSNSIFRTGKNDTLFIAVSLVGKAIKYQNVVFGEQTDSRILNKDNGVKVFDDSHGSCPFELLEKTFFVLNKVERTDKISDSQIEKLKFRKTDLTGIKIFLVE